MTRLKKKGLDNFFLLVWGLKKKTKRPRKVTRQKESSGRDPGQTVAKNFSQEKIKTAPKGHENRQANGGTAKGPAMSHLNTKINSGQAGWYPPKKVFIQLGSETPPTRMSTRGMACIRKVVCRGRNGWGKGSSPKIWGKGKQVAAANTELLQRSKNRK